MKPVCVPCQRFYRPKKNGYYFLEGMPHGPDYPKPGREEPEKWKPYKLWVGDLWQCPSCKATIVSGVGQNAIAEHWQPDFGNLVEVYGAELLVKDC